MCCSVHRVGASIARKGEDKQAGNTTFTPTSVKWVVLKDYQTSGVARASLIGGPKKKTIGARGAPKSFV